MAVNKAQKRSMMMVDALAHATKAGTVYFACMIFALYAHVFVVLTLSDILLTMLYVCLCLRENLFSR